MAELVLHHLGLAHIGWQSALTKDRRHEMCPISAEALGRLAAGKSVRAYAVGAINATCHAVTVSLGLDRLRDNRLWDDRLWDNRLPDLLVLSAFAVMQVSASVLISVLASVLDFMLGFVSDCALGAEAEATTLSAAASSSS